MHVKNHINLMEISRLLDPTKSVINETRVMKDKCYLVQLVSSFYSLGSEKGRQVINIMKL